MEGYAEKITAAIVEIESSDFSWSYLTFKHFYLK